MTQLLLVTTTLSGNSFALNNAEAGGDLVN